jgi:gliding motility-associated-like protein
MVKKLLLSSALLLILILFGSGSIRAQMVGPNAYIKGNSVEIGLSGIGGFEGCPTSTSPPLAGMHYRSSTGYFGFVSNPQVNAWATYDGDFFTPGTPENGWGIELPSGVNYGNNCAYLQEINGSITSWSQIVNCISATWDGDLTSGTNLHIKINYFLQLNDLYYTTTVSVTNNTASTIPTLYYYRNFDPDNNQPISGDFTTTNTIVSQPTSGACNTAHVKATSVLPSSQPMSYVGLAATGANWRASYGGFSNRDGSDLWNGVGFTQTVGSSTFADIAIALAYKISNLAPGATETFKFVVILDDLAAAQAVANTTYLSYPGSATAPPSVCTPYADSVKICQGVPATIGVSGPNIAQYTWSWSPATGLSSSTGSSVSASPSTTTSYTVTGTPINSCFAAISFPFVVQVKPSPVVNPEPNLTYCAGTAVPANGFTSTPAGATYTWTNSNSAIGLAASGSGGLPAFTATNSSGAPITSTITVTPTIAGNPCPGIPLSFTITVNPNPVVTVNSATICPGQMATLTAAGATTYLWNTGSTANPLSVSPGATTSYTVTGTTSGCTGSAVATVTIGGSIGVTVNSATICSGTTATLTAAGAATYTWSTGSTVNPLSVSPAATTSYTVTGTSSGCTGSAIATVTVNPVPTVVTETDITACAGTSIAANTFASTPAGATFSWTNSDPSIGLTASGTGGLPAFTATNAGASPVTATITITPSLSGCTGPVSTFTITVNPLPVTMVNSPAICSGTAASLTAVGATTYTWSAGATSTGANTATASPATTTSYTVTGTSLGCSSSAISTVTVNPGLTPDAGLDDTVCFGGSTVLNVTPNGAGYSYSWTPTATLTGATTQNPTAAPAATTTYSVLVTDPSGCTGTSSVTIYADPQITTAIAGIDVTCNGACNGQTIVIPGGGTSGYTYNWSSGCTGASCTSLCPGTYTVTVTDAWGCTNTASTSVTEPTLLTASVTASAPATCNAACDGTATAAAAGGTSGYTYSWNTVPVQNTATATGLCAGNYTCTITDANSCTATTTVTITEPTVVVIAPIASVSVCSGGTATLTASASGGNPGGYSYVWSPAGTGSTASVTVTPASTTVYSVNATDPNGCPSAPVNVTVTVGPALTVAAAGGTSICPGATASLSATASNGNGGPYTYTWSPAGTGSGSPVSVSPAATTTYTVTADDGCSPTATATVTVTVLPLPVVSFSADVTSGCDPVCVNFTDNTTVGGGGSAASWTWNFGDATTDNTQNPPTHCFTTNNTNGNVSYTIGLTVTSTDGCVSSSTVTNMITVHPMPHAEFDVPSSVSIITPEVQFTDLSSNAVSWSWNFGDPMVAGGGTSTQQNPVYTYTDAGTYYTTLLVTSAYGCTDSVPHVVIVDPEFTFFIPNAFSPNGDGVNDEFFGKGEYIKNFEMQVYDRWGNLIFFADDINKHWDGKANHGGEIAQQDVYVYVVKITDFKDKKHKYTGTVTIVK